MLTIKDKAEELGFSVATLRRWHKKGLLCHDFITYGGHRRYKKTIHKANRQVIGYSNKKNVTYYVSCIKQNTVVCSLPIKKTI